ncbi:ABC transporter substrate-binding protein [Anaerosalibacter massiliensis]|uniref:ABC transporter substrate-binding protein n=1 Tax=Anaerosalibacter massiliensis TaxID=1347392 RepID=A0A9X2MFU2_9FIRM|nr:ABC transporter substrate-binding protein [Anaerosalibacter massiliensis]MCR2042879.1 ABC transporter substrate-binding protein [Anaerosalibacter massiliensis]
MKKYKLSSILVLIILASTIIFTGCNVNSKKDNNTSGNEVFKIGISQLSEHPALDEVREGFEDELKNLGVNVEINYQNSQGDIANTVSIAQIFSKNKMDLIFAIATPAAQSAKQVTRNIPILFSAVTDPVKSEIIEDWENINENVTGTSDMAPTASQLKMFKEIDPNIKTIGILYNTSETNSEIQIEEVNKLASSEDLKVVTIGVSNVNELPQALNSIMKKADALYLLTDNMVASSIELISKTAIENKMITVSAEETQVRGGALITNGISYYELGKQTGQMAKKILVDKKDISEIPVEVSEKTITKINRNTLDKLGLNPNLPVFKKAVEVENKK